MSIQTFEKSLTIASALAAILSAGIMVAQTMSNTQARSQAEADDIQPCVVSRAL